jgi:pilus assembly protein CpaF
VSLHDVFESSQTGVDKGHNTEGYFRATGIRPHCLATVNLRGASLAPGMFNERRLPTPKPFGGSCRAI